MISVLVTGGRSFRNWALLDQTLDALLSSYKELQINVRGEGALARYATSWAIRNKAATDDVIVFGCFDLVVAFPGTGVETHLRQAWKHRIPALRVLSDGTGVRIGIGWGELLKKRRLRAV